MTTIGLVVLLVVAWMVLQSRINAGDESPWPWQKLEDRPPF